MLAIKNGRILTMDRAGLIEKGTIIIEDGFIREVGTDVEIKKECQVIDAAGCYVTPGFIDSHTHIGLEEEIYRVEGDDVNEIDNPISPELQAVDGINFADLAFTDALRGGVTRSVSMPGSANIIGGQAVFLKHLAENMTGMIYKNPLALKAALGENPKRVYAAEKKSPKTRMANASLLRQAFYNALKKMEKKDLSPEEEFKLLPLFKVLRREIPLFLHAHRADDILTALRIKDEFGFDLVIQHGTEAFMVADELVKRDVPVFLGPLLVNRAKVEMKEVSFRNAYLLAKAGVNFAFITDHPVIPVEHLRVCAALAVREGLEEEKALKALTWQPARILKCDDELGSIAPGKRADIVIFDGHPLDFRTRVRYVLVDGLLWGDKLE
ncbi:Imidazolonepropionase [Thermosyntropha lipolytica DSM 11003]|uniref:Imidazolonepropionase n=1 Tax=Thermosyntropha lipolytica DSM 11003 TaxID=1123382 RepID=A0A1M5JEX2_9FIRM|nr:amidohydrolase [Thermosyntropha lipolytica]SHG39146.1 Imidazolonepropionase [Thermosyntropha lipolytica DSM 11003]